MALIQGYFDDTERYIAAHGSRTIVLIQVGSFFEVYGKEEQDGTISGSLIQDFAALADLKIAEKNVIIDGKPVKMAGFGLGQLDKYVRKLLDNSYTIPVIVQDVNPDNSISRSLAYIYSPGTYFNENDSGNGRQDLSNYTMCIWLHLAKANSVIKESFLTIGISAINILTGKVINYEYRIQFADSPTVYDQLEKYVAIYCPAEVILITNNCKDKDKSSYLDQVISYANIKAKMYHKIYLSSSEKIASNCEKQIYIEAQIDKIYGQGSFLQKAEFRDYYIANQSLCFLLNFIERHNPALLKQIEYPTFDNHSNQLVLANHSLKQLNIIEMDSSSSTSNKLSSVLSLLNNCVTNAGKRRFSHELLHPISDAAMLELMYGVTDELLHTGFHRTIREGLSGVRDIEKIERRLAMRRIDPRDFYFLYQNFLKIYELEMRIREKESYDLLNMSNFIDEEFKSTNTSTRLDFAKICKDTIHFLEDHFNMDKAAQITMDKLGSHDLVELDFINNKELSVLLKSCVDAREQLEAIVAYLSGLLTTVEKPKAKSTNTNTNTNTNTFVNLHETVKNDPILTITKRRMLILQELIEKEIKIKKNGMITITYLSKFSKKDETILLDLIAFCYKPHGTGSATLTQQNHTTYTITSKQIAGVAHSIQNSKDELIDAISRIYANIVQDAASKIATNLATISRKVGLLDLFHVKAYNAEKFNYCRPTIVANPGSSSSSSYVSFKMMRHVLIEHINIKELYVANDLDLSLSEGKGKGILLYGTNAVGKTSFIKSIGIAIVLAQAGMFVPCSEFIFYPYQYLFTRILGNDNLFKGLSTFAVEMSELRTILKNATNNSIVLGDELCSGTESSSALSIFVASLEQLHKVAKSTFLFATHFHEIMEYDEIKDMTAQGLRTYHMSVIFDRENKKLIYDRILREGPGEAMYGLEVCKSLDLPGDFIERAYELRNKYCSATYSATYSLSSATSATSATSSSSSSSCSQIMDSNTTAYNAKKIKEKICELCEVSLSTDIHHLQFQKNADPVTGIIHNGSTVFKKNAVANLVSICERCHDRIHKEDIQFKRVKTDSGYEFIKID